MIQDLRCILFAQEEGSKNGGSVGVRGEGIGVKMGVGTHVRPTYIPTHWAPAGDNWVDTYWVWAHATGYTTLIEKKARYYNLFKILTSSMYIMVNF